MKKLLALLFVALFAMNGAVYAGVTFLPAAQGIGNGSSIKTNTPTPAEKCTRLGYRMTSCQQTGEVLRTPCPHDGRYYKECCKSEYRFTKEDCERNGFKASSRTCGGFHECLLSR